MTNRTRLSAIAFSLLLVAGCASSGVSSRQPTAAQETMTKPNHVVVYNFAGTPADLPPDSVIAKLYQERDTPQSADEVRLGQQMGYLVARHLVEKLKAAGIPAQSAAAGPVPLVGDAVIRGEFITVDQGNRLKRVLIGFGSGSAELKTLAEAYQVTATGLRPIGSAEIESEGGSLPGMLVPLGVGAAAGTLAVSAAVGATTAVLKESGPETLDAAANRTADEIAKIVIDYYKKRGWL